MKKLLQTLFFFLLLVQAGYTQWARQNPVPPVNGFLCVEFISESTGFAAGDEAMMLKTTDGGASWEIKDLGYYCYLVDIEFINENTGWALDFYFGRIFKTTDSGNNWFLAADLEDFIFWDMTFVNSSVGWVTGYNRIYKTINGGITWFEQYLSTSYIESIFFLNAQIGWAAAVGNLSAVILKTTNGGNSWTEYPQISIHDLNKVYFISSTTGFAAGSDGTLSGDGGYIYISTNGGISWSINFTGRRYSDFEFVNSQIAFAAGSDILKTTNGGITWNNILPNAGVNSISFWGSNVGYAVNGSGLIIKTNEGGETWVTLSYGDNRNLNSIDFADRNSGVAVGHGGKIIRTTNGGQNWESITNISEAWSFYSVSFPDTQNVWISGHYGGIYHSSDGGINWIQQNSGVTLPLRSIYFIDSETGWAAGNAGLIIKTTNGGQTWFLTNTGTNGWFHSIYFINQDIGWAAGSYSNLVKTTDGGLTWQQLSIAGVQFFNSVYFLNESTGWLADESSGGISSIYKTTDGGITWISQLDITEDSFRFNDVYFKDDNFGWAVAAEGQIWFTTDGGTNWTLNEDNIYNSLESIAHCETGEIWIAGNYEMILYSYNGGIPVEILSFTGMVKNRSVELKWTTATELNNAGFEILRSISGLKWEKIGLVSGQGTSSEIHNYSFTDNRIIPGKYNYKLKQIDYDGSFEYSNEIEVEIGMPDEFVLYQNYPNPFNPTTRIKFTISDFGFTTLKIYGVLGEEIATLVNEEKPPGVYEVEFDGSKLSSGVYFYILQSGNFRSVKKLLFMK